MEDHLALDLHPIVGHDDVGVELRMDHRQVIAFQIVLHIGLPVAGQDVAAPFHQRETRERRRGRQRRQKVRKRRGLEVQVCEHQPLPGLHPHREQSIRAGVEAGRGSEIDGVPQPPVERIAPAVIAADEGLATAAPAIRHQGAGAVSADVVEPGHPALGVPHHDHRGAADRFGDIVSGRRDHRLVADELPGATQHLRALRPQRRLALVELNRQHGASGAWVRSGSRRARRPGPAVRPRSAGSAP